MVVGSQESDATRVVRFHGHAPAGVEGVQRVENLLEAPQSVGNLNGFLQVETKTPTEARAVRAARVIVSQVCRTATLTQRLAGPGRTEVFNRGLGVGDQEI